MSCPCACSEWPGSQCGNFVANMCELPQYRCVSGLFVFIAQKGTRVADRMSLRSVAMAAWCALCRQEFEKNFPYGGKLSAATVTVRACIAVGVIKKHPTSVVCNGYRSCPVREPPLGWMQDRSHERGSPGSHPKRGMCFTFACMPSA